MENDQIETARVVVAPTLRGKVSTMVSSSLDAWGLGLGLELGLG